MNKAKDILLYVIHTASQAVITGDNARCERVLADIHDAIESIVPVDGKRRGAEKQSIDALKAALDKIEIRLRVLNKSNMLPEQVRWIGETQLIAADATGRAASMTPPPDEPQGYAKFLTVGRGVTLVRFAGADEIKLVARRVGSQGHPNTLFEINVDKEHRLATVFRDNRYLFAIKGHTVNHSMVERMAVSALHRWFKGQRKHNSKRRRAAKLREGILTPDAEIAETVKRQGEEA